MPTIFLTNSCIICTRRSFLETYTKLGSGYATRYLTALEERILRAKNIRQLRFCSDEHKEECVKLRNEYKETRKKDLLKQIESLKNAYILLQRANYKYEALVNGGATPEQISIARIKKIHAARVCGQRERRIREDHVYDKESKELITPLDSLIHQARIEAETEGV